MIMNYNQFTMLIPFTTHHRLLFLTYLKLLILLPKFKLSMHKNRYYKAPKPQLKSEKQIRKSKPEWTTDFSDPNKYKLSEAQMIERKAALQSKNREAARHALEERRRKLQMGVIDEDTRKVYETALTSKKIEINPPIRKNLSQMIQEERQKKNMEMMKMQNQGYYEEEQQDNDDIQRQIEEARNFIKKLQKAKKQNNIEKAVNIINDDKKSQFFGMAKSYHQEVQSRPVLSSLESQQQASHSQALSNIEETIKFMEDKLFKKSQKQSIDKQYANPRPIINQLNSPDTNPISHQDSYDLTSINHENESGHEREYEEYENQREQSFNEFFRKQKNHQIIMKQSKQQKDQKNSQKPSKVLSLEQEFEGLKIQLNEQSPPRQINDDDDCMSTIRRMREMIESKEYLYEPENNQKENNSHLGNRSINKFNEIITKNEDDEQVDFSLTMNEEQQESLHLDIKKDGFKKGNAIKSYEEVKKNLFEEIDQLNNYKVHQNGLTSNQNTKQDSSNTLYYESHDFYDHQGHPSQQKQSQQPIKVSNKIKKKKKNKDSLTNQFKELESMIELNKSTVQKLKVEPINVYGNSGVMGFDYRGSINLKKNIIREQ